MAFIHIKMGFFWQGDETLPVLFKNKTDFKFLPEDAENSP